MVIATSQRLCIKNTPTSPVCHIWRKHYSIYMPAKGLTAEWDLIPNSWEILCAILCLLSPSSPWAGWARRSPGTLFPLKVNNFRLAMGRREGRARENFFFFLCTIFKVLVFFVLLFYSFFCLGCIRSSCIVRDLCLWCTGSLVVSRRLQSTQAQSLRCTGLVSRRQVGSQFPDKGSIPRPLQCKVDS